MSRLPAHLEVKALQRLAESRGDFAMVLHRGEREQGSILLVLRSRDGSAKLCERLPNIAGPARWSFVFPKNIVTDEDLDRYLQRRTEQDIDLWTIELTVADAERFVLDLSLPG